MNQKGTQDEAEKIEQAAAEASQDEMAQKPPLLDQDIQDIEGEIEKLKEQITRLQEDERRARADYQNLMRRTQEDRIKLVKLAGRDVIEKLLQPFEHLYLAKEQLKDKGLDMVYMQFKQAFEEVGLEEITCVGCEFSEETMEVVDKQKVDDEKQAGRVVKVMQRGYRLNGEVIQHAKVIIADTKGN